MKTKTITLTVEEWRIITDALDEHQDEGPVGGVPFGGWKSDKLIEALVSLNASLQVAKENDSNQ